MNIVLLADKKYRKNFENAVKSNPDINLVGVEMIARGNTMSRIADFHNPHLLVVYRNTPVKDGITIDDIISFLQVKKPLMRIVYVYGNIIEFEDFINKSEELMNNGIYDIISTDSIETVINVINEPMNQEKLQKSIEELRESNKKKEVKVDNDETNELTYETLNLDFPAVTAKNNFDIDNILIISTNSKEIETINIGIAQLQHHNGCTHTSLEIASLLKKKYNVAVVIADDDTFNRLAVYHKINPLFAQEGLNYNGIDIYPYSKMEELNGIYNAIICDYSFLKESQQLSYEKSDVKIMLASAAEWDISTLIKHVEYSNEQYIRDINILLPRVTRSKFTKYNKRFLKSGVRAYRLHNSPDWTTPNQDNVATYKKILDPYIIKPSDKKKKKKLFRLK